MTLLAIAAVVVVVNGLNIKNTAQSTRFWLFGDTFSTNSDNERMLNTSLWSMRILMAIN